MRKTFQVFYLSILPCWVRCKPFFSFPKQSLSSLKYDISKEREKKKSSAHCIDIVPNSYNHYDINLKIILTNKHIRNFISHRVVGSRYLRIIGRVWANYLYLSVASRSTISAMRNNWSVRHWPIAILCDNRVQIFFHQVLSYLNTSESSRNRSAIFHIIMHEETIYRSRGGCSANEKEEKNSRNRDFFLAKVNQDWKAKNIYKYVVLKSYNSTS